MTKRTPKKELKRLKLLNKFEDEARLKGYQLIAGVDEVGRGPLAGPVVAAACMIPEGIYIPGVDDSKVLPPHIRQHLFEQITQDTCIQYGIGIVDWIEIDRINIYQASIQAMLMAIGQLANQPHCILVDGLKLPHSSIPCVKIIKGDALSQSIAAASIVAKVIRDKIMIKYHERWPEYGFDQHKGYATPQHLKALEKHGPCEIHRRSFAPVPASCAEAVIS